MSYLEDFQNQINNHDFHKFFQLWEEYCTNDQADAEEFIAVLNLVKKSEFAPLFGQFAETALPLWNIVEDEKLSYEILKRIIDLQTSNSPILYETAMKALENKFGKDPLYKERLRQIGMRGQTDFKGAISNYELLNHMSKGNFVLHTSGWGTGEIVDFSPIREQVGVEFENVAGIKHLSFDHAFKTLIPLPKEHFLARRFADADALEDQAKKDPVEVIKALLRDLGPKTAAEIKEEISGLVIPDDEWGKWWQGARARLKKDTMVDTPNTLKEPFRLRKVEITHEDQLHEAIRKKTDIDDIVQTTYSYVRDLPHVLRKQDVKDTLKEKLLSLLSRLDLTSVQELQILIFLETVFNHQSKEKSAKDMIVSTDPIEPLMNGMDIQAFKKRALTIIRESRSDWVGLFLKMLYSVNQAPLRDYILKELNTDPVAREILIKRLKELLRRPEEQPEVFIWYFQKIGKKTPEDVPFSSQEGQAQFFEAFLILLHKIEHEAKWRDLTKKMYTMMIAKNFVMVRTLIENSTIEFIKEFLLLVSKCHIFNDHDKSIMRSLAQVVHPSLAPSKKSTAAHDMNVLWTTQEGYVKTQQRVKHIGTVEMIANAREVEAARSHGDLRENAEYKFAVERRSRLQSEMKTLSKLLGKARVLTPDDIDLSEVGVGSIVEVEDTKGQTVTYTILGPWEADPDQHVISYQSQMAQAMAGNKTGDRFKFRDEEFEIKKIRSFFEAN